jgi:hypothetical protein
VVRIVCCRLARGAGKSDVLAARDAI